MTETAADWRAADPRLALPAVEAGLELLGAPLTGYQIRAAAAMSTPNPAGAGYAYPRVVMVMPRQVGKTTLLACLALGRGRRAGDYRAAYAAQTGHVTSQRFREWADALRRRPGWKQDYSIRSAAGTERITTAGTGSYLRAFPPIPGRLRSVALDLVIVDEAQEHDDIKTGQPLDASILPTMDTRPWGQWIIAGTAGDLTATYFHRHYTSAAAGAAGTLLIELGTWPAEADPEDPGVWRAHHPGIRSGRTTVEKLAAALATMGPETFAREYGNRWTQALALSLFPLGAWRDCHQPAAGIVGPVSLALEVPPNREHGYIVAAGQSTHHPDHMHVEVAAVLPLAQIVPTALRLTAEHSTPLIVDQQAPTVAHVERLRRARVPVRPVNIADLTNAAATLYDRITERTLTHLDQPPLTTAALAASKRTMGARWTFDRYAPNGAVIVAAALAVLWAGRQHGQETRTIIG